MTHEDHTLVAESIALAVYEHTHLHKMTQDEHDLVTTLKEKIANAFQKKNPRTFSRDQFFENCRNIRRLGL